MPDSPARVLRHATVDAPVLEARACVAAWLGLIPESIERLTIVYVDDGGSPVVDVTLRKP